MKLYIEFYHKKKFYRWGLFYRDPKKFISFHHISFEPKTRKQRLKDFFYYGVYANFKYWKICLFCKPRYRIQNWILNLRQK